MDTQRAKDLIRLAKYEDGMCGMVGAVRPDVEPMTTDERRMLSMIWRNMSGGSTMMDVLYEIANGRALVPLLGPALLAEINKPNNGLA